jgi:hypothetical protein
VLAAAAAKWNRTYVICIHMLIASQSMGKQLSIEQIKMKREIDTYPIQVPKDRILETERELDHSYVAFGEIISG